MPTPSLVSESASGSTFVTLPTSTPAIRTGEFGRRFWAERKTAETSVPPPHGTFFVNAT